MDLSYLAPEIHRQLHELYDLKEISQYLCANNRFYRHLMLISKNYPGKIIVGGDHKVGGNLSLQELNSLTGKFKSLDFEVARFQQEMVERHNVLLELDSYRNNTAALVALYFLETAECYFQKSKTNGTIEEARCTRSISILNNVPSAPKKVIEKAYEYVSTDLKAQIESGIVRAVQIHYDERRVVSLKHIKIYVNSQILSPSYIVQKYSNNMLNFLQCHMVKIRYAEDKEICDFHATLQQSVLVHHYGVGTAQDILNRCYHMDRHLASIPVVVVDGADIAIRSINFFNICSISVAK